LSSFEFALSVPAPKQNPAFALVGTQYCGGFEQQSKDHGAIIVGQIDQA